MCSKYKTVKQQQQQYRKKKQNETQSHAKKAHNIHKHTFYLPLKVSGAK